MNNDPRFPPARWQSPNEPWESPTLIPPSPHNLPLDSFGRGGRGGGGQSVGVQNTMPGGGAEVLSVRETYRYASIIDVNLTIGTTSVKFLDAPIGKRNMLGFRNVSTGGQILYVGFGGPASSISWLTMTAGVIVLFDTVVPQDDLYVISSAAGGSFSYMYSTFGG